MNKTTVLFPGGFKPITGAHLALAQRYANSSNVERVIMLIGPKERDGVSRKDSEEIFRLINNNSKIELRATDLTVPLWLRMSSCLHYQKTMPEHMQWQLLKKEMITPEH